MNTNEKAAIVVLAVVALIVIVFAIIFLVIVLSRKTSTGSWACTVSPTDGSTSCAFDKDKPPTRNESYATQEECTKECKAKGTWFCDGIGTATCNYDNTDTKGFKTEPECTSSVGCNPQGKVWACNGAGTCNAFSASSNDPPNVYPTKAACQQTCK